MNNLSEYNKKRDFNKTKEPKGIKKVSKKKLKFVIQHHLARKDHYDLRLEYNGVYKSFAIPKGPSFNPKDKRLAIQVEDHPLSYGNFEGVIPKGEYGGGTVMVFDKGYWEPLNKVDFKKGPLKFKLNGIRLKGSWSLIYLKDDNWLMIKEKDDYVKKQDINNYKTSVKSGKTFQEIENNNDVEITHPDKIIYPKNKITKQEIIDYYKLVSIRMMPFLENRLISTIRCPDGLKKEKFFMKHFNTNSKNLGKKLIKEKTGKDYYYYIKNITGLLEEVQMNSYEFHIWNSLQKSVKKPDILVFDLDPDEDLNIDSVREGVRDLKKILDELNLKSYLKTSGGKGYHIVVPLNLPSYKRCEEISYNIAKLLEERYPDKYTTNIRKDNRKGKIFIDYLRNKFGATSVCPYSLRLKDNAPVSCPISWRELDKIKPQDITIKNIKERLRKKDPWQDFFTN